MDLLVTTFELWPEKKQTLRVYKNTLTDGGNWIGFRFREAGSNPSPAGVRVTVHCQGRGVVRQLVTGDSYRSQPANTIHFGLGEATKVDSVEIRWANGQALQLSAPTINCYHAVAPPAKR